MKLNVAFHTLLVAISAASGAHARATSFLRDPRTVEGKEPVQRQTMGEYVTKAVSDADAGGMTCEKRIADKAGDNPTDEQRSQACSAVSKVYPICRGCQGYSQMGKEVVIPACVGMTPDDCKKLAGDIVKDKPGWFKKGSNTDLQRLDKVIALPSEMAYYKIGLPVEANSIVGPDDTKQIKSLAGDCMVQYQWDWCVHNSNVEGTTCLQLQPWDCSKEGESGCLSAHECCVKIQGNYPKPDINGNELQCYEWELPMTGTPATRDPNATTGPTGIGPPNTPNPYGPVGDQLVIHVSGGTVALPAVITDEITYATREAVDNEEVMQPATYYIGYNTGGCQDKNEPNPPTVSVVEECAAACDDLEGCVSFEYKKGTGTPDCKLSKDCLTIGDTVNDPRDEYMWYLKVTDSATKADPKAVAYLWVLDHTGDHTGEGWVSPPSGLTSTKYYTGYDSGGCKGLNEIDSVRTIHSVEDCAAECDEHERCISFEYEKKGTNCLMSTNCDITQTGNNVGDDYMWYEKATEYTGRYTGLSKNKGGNAYLWIMNNAR